MRGDFSGGARQKILQENAEKGEENSTLKNFYFGLIFCKKCRRLSIVRKERKLCDFCAKISSEVDRFIICGGEDCPKCSEHKIIFLKPRKFDEIRSAGEIRKKLDQLDPRFAVSFVAESGLFL